MVHIFEDVGVFVPADPAQGIKLKEALLDIGEERSEFECADVEFDANFTQLLLKNGCEEARALLGG